MQRLKTFGGGVSPRGTLLRGQSIIEYVLIAAVIGLVIVFAGPGVAGTIRNQFNQVTNTVDSGTSGDGFISAEEKAHQEAMKNIAAKMTRDWTLDELKEVATDISKNGTSSVVYAKAKDAMIGKTTWSIKLTNGETMTCRIIGINHDDLADGSGKAGLTFITTSSNIKSRMNATKTTVGGWEKSELRQKMNSGEIWNLMSSELQSKVKAVKKSTDNYNQGKFGTPTTTIDKLFLPSVTDIFGSEIHGYKLSDGLQYEYYSMNGVTPDNDFRAYQGENYWTRSVCRSVPTTFYAVYTELFNWVPNSFDTVYPTFCF